jgi:hypothetical protein
MAPRIGGRVCERSFLLLHLLLSRTYGHPRPRRPEDGAHEERSHRREEQKIANLVRQHEGDRRKKEQRQNMDQRRSSEHRGCQYGDKVVEESAYQPQGTPYEGLGGDSLGYECRPPGDVPKECIDSLRHDEDREQRATGRSERVYRAIDEPIRQPGIKLQFISLALQRDTCAAR